MGTDITKQVAERIVARLIGDPGVPVLLGHDRADAPPEDCVAVVATAQERDGAGGATVTLAVSCHLPADADGMAPADAAESACAHATLAALRAAAEAETGHARIVRTWELSGTREDSFEEGGRVVCAWECRLGINRLAAAFEGD